MTIKILGIRGLPATHGGFETFCERLVPELVSMGHDVVVYCQSETNFRSQWRGAQLVGIKSKPSGIGSVWFDLKSILRAAREPGPNLVFGYNTAIFLLALRLTGKRFAVNMDGIEWRRRKWGSVAKVWFYLNELIAIAIAPILIADHPVIEKHLKRFGRSRPVHMIPYAADSTEPPTTTDSEDASPYATVIARWEPENQILEIVRTWSRRPRGAELIVLGNPDTSDPYHAAVLEAASPEVNFPGAIFDRDRVNNLRLRSAFFIYGHTVGGTSPTLVEALGAGNPCLAYNSPYPQWVAGGAARYFSTEDELDELIERLLSDGELRQQMATRAKFQHQQHFTWQSVYDRYVNVINELEEL